MIQGEWEECLKMGGCKWWYGDWKWCLKLGYKLLAFSIKTVKVTLISIL
jgi:hypothetical protein